MVSLKEDTLCAQFGDNRSKIVATIVLKDMYKASIQSLLRLSLKLSDLKKLPLALFATNFESKLTNSSAFRIDINKLW